MHQMHPAASRPGRQTPAVSHVVRLCSVQFCSASHSHSDACPDCEQPKFMYSNYINDTGHAHLFEKERTSFVHLDGSSEERIWTAVR